MSASLTSSNDPHYSNRPRGVRETCTEAGILMHSKFPFDFLYQVGVRLHFYHQQFTDWAQFGEVFGQINGERTNLGGR